MAALRSRCGHYIFVLWFLLSSFLFPRLISAVGDWCGLSANLGCMSEMCCTQIAPNSGRKTSPSQHHRTTLLGYILATKAHIDNRKKLLSSNIASTRPDNMVNFGPLMAEIGSRVWGTPTNFNGFCILFKMHCRTTGVIQTETASTFYPP